VPIGACFTTDSGLTSDGHFQPFFLSEPSVSLSGALGPIDIGRQVTISQGAHLCAGSHDYKRADMPLLKPPITIRDAAWVCADAFIGPNVEIGNLAIVGARAVAMKNVPAGAIVAGNPARQVGSR
jgi:putative colanic acid biosynthesis acetyltransferase WcaF